MKYKLVNYFAGDNGNVNCSLCGSPHNHQYWLEDEDGKDIEVGSECARKLLGITSNELKEMTKEIIVNKALKKQNSLHIQYLNDFKTKIGLQGKLKLVTMKAEELEKEGWEEIDRGSIDGGSTMFITMKRS